MSGSGSGRFQKSETDPDPVKNRPDPQYSFESGHFTPLLKELTIKGLNFQTRKLINFLYFPEKCRSLKICCLVIQNFIQNIGHINKASFIKKN
jgi:hypothetical protein